MKKLYFFILFTLFTVCAGAQVTTYAYAVGAGLSYTTGNSTSTVRTDNTIVANNTTRGYAVFNIGALGIPAGSTIYSVVVGYNVTASTGGPASGSTNYYVGSLSGVSTAATLYNDMIPPTSTNVSALAYGAVGNQTFASTAAFTGMVAANLTGTVSLCFTVSFGGASYTVTGETGAMATTGAHAPYLQIIYCPPPTAVTATASPNPVCSGSTLNLVGSATGATAYSWTGPAAYSSVGASQSLTATSSGVYTLSAVNSCGTYSASMTAYTATVVVNPLPASITGTTTVCTAGNTTLSSTTTPGTWTSGNTAVATVVPTSGAVTGVAAGTSMLTYTVGSGCYTTAMVTDNAPPSAITGLDEVCQDASTNLYDAIGGGSWSTVAGTGSASINATTGYLTGTAAGALTAVYTITGCTPATYGFTVNPIPAAITGGANLCEGDTVTLAIATSGGTWSSYDPIVASVDSITGFVSGLLPGTTTIYYTVSGFSCQASEVFQVYLVPNPIVGAAYVCPAGSGSSVTFSDGTPGGTWTSVNPTIASVVAGTGSVTGLAVGTSIITYQLATTCYATKAVTILPPVPGISGITTFCNGQTQTLSDATSGGTWSSSVTSVATIGATGIATGISSGLSSISYVLPDGCYNVSTVTILATTPVGISYTGATQFCSGGSLTLTATTGGTSYQWLMGGSPITGANLSTYTALLTGAYTVEMTNGAGCTSTSAPINISDGLTPTISSSLPSTSFCIGNGTTLTCNTVGILGAISYQWSFNGAPLLTGTAATYFANVAGVYSCSVSVAGGGSGSCLAVTPDVSVTVYPLPEPTVSFNGVSVITQDTFLAYQWYVNTTAITGATNYYWTPVVNGSYRVQVTDNAGCSWYSNQYEYTSFVNTGVSTVNPASFSVYPNPAENTVYISAPVAVDIKLTAVDGKLIVQKNNATSVDLTGIPGGVYILELYDENGIKLCTKKIEKQ